MVVSILGFSYKKNTSDARSTVSSDIVNYLAERGVHVKIHDPQCT